MYFLQFDIAGFLPWSFCHIHIASIWKCTGQLVVSQNIALSKDYTHIFKRNVSSSEIHLHRIIILISIRTNDFSNIYVNIRKHLYVQH